MNGKELLEALSYIDEELLAEADLPAQRNGWRQWGALAACLCILILGTISFRQLFRNGPMEGTADEALPGSALAAGSAQYDSSLTAESAEEEPRSLETSALTDEANTAGAVSTAQVRIVEATKDGIIALMLTGEQDLEGLAVTLIPEEGVDLSTVEEGSEYTVWIIASEADGSLWICDIRPTEQEE